MKRFKNILLVCNFEVKQQMAMACAILLARQNEASLTVFTVIREISADALSAITIMPPQVLFEQVLDGYNEQIELLADDILQQGTDVKSKIATGTPFLEIIRQVLRNDTKQQYSGRLNSLVADIDLMGITTHKHLIKNADAATGCNACSGCYCTVCRGCLSGLKLIQSKE